MVHSHLITFGVVLFLSFSASCTSTYDKSELENLLQVEALPYSSELTSVQYSYEGLTSILNAGEIINVDDRYLVVSDAEEEAIFKVFNLPELNYLYSWGRRGQGPDEYELLPLVDINTTEDKLIVYNLSSRNIYYYSVNDTTFIPDGHQSLSYENESGFLSKVVRLNDSLFVADYGKFYEQTSHEYIALQPNLQTPRFTFGRFPSSGLTGPERYYQFFKTGVSNEARGEFASFYFYYNRFKVFNYEGEEQVYVHIKDDSIAEVDNLTARIDTYTSGSESSFRYRKAQWASDNYLYALGINEYRDVINENLDSFRPSLEIWDWNGNQVYRAMFDTTITHFTVSEKHGNIYAYSLLDNNSIYVYDIPEIIPLSSGMVVASVRE